MKKRAPVTLCSALATILCLDPSMLSAAEQKPPLAEVETAPEKTAEETVIEGKASVPGRLAFPSPNGKYAITWPSRSEAEAGNVGNHLVTVADGKSIHLITPEGDYEGRRAGMYAKWSTDSRAAVVRLMSK